MAVQQGYGKMAGTDALVFAYDTGDTVNSYKGRPTTNYGPASFGNWGTEGSAERIATGNTYNGQPAYNCRTVVGESWRGIDTTISGLRTAAGSSGTVTMSCMVRNNNPSNYSMYAYIGHDFGSTRTIVANSNWQKVQWTVNQSSMNNDYVEFRPYTNNASVYLEMTMPMVEVNVTYASQFTAGTRSTTQGLLDLTGTTSIDLTNTSYDGNAQLEFDGTDDKIDIPTNFGVLDEYTFEYVAYANSTHNMPVSSRTSTAFYKYGAYSWRYTHGGVGGEFYHNTGNATGWAHYAITYDGTTITVWENGVSKGTRASTGTADFSSGIRIGSWASSASYTWDGTIPVMKMYNRALSAAEVKSNFSNYKTRFNIV